MALFKDRPRWGPKGAQAPPVPPTSNCQTQKLNKNNKNIHNGDCILATTTTTTTKTILPPKNHVLLEKPKLNFFCNYNKMVFSKLLKIKYNILLRLSLYLQ